VPPTPAPAGQNGTVTESAERPALTAAERQATERQATEALLTEAWGERTEVRDCSAPAEVPDWWHPNL
jgi:hypothetical protein